VSTGKGVLNEAKGFGKKKKITAKGKNEEEEKKKKIEEQALPKKPIFGKKTFKNGEEETFGIS